MLLTRWWTTLHDDYLAVNVALMRLTGLWPDSNSDKAKSAALVLYLGSFIALQVAAMDARDPQELTEIGCFCLNSTLSLFKICHMLVYQRRLRALAAGVGRACTLYGRLCPDASAALRTTEKQLSVGTLAFIAFAGFVSALFVLLPFLAPDLELSLPVKMWFPLDSSRGAGFLLAWIYAAGLFLVLTPVYVLLQTFYVGLVMLTCGQLKALCSLLAAGGDVGLCVRLHCRTLRFGKELEAILSPLLLAQFLVGTAIICQTAIQVTLDPVSLMRTAKFVSYLAVVLLDLWLYCYFGSQLEHHSTRVQIAAYSCPWYEMTGSQQKSLLLVMRRSQRPMTLTVGKMANVSLGTFTEVIKMSYSLFTLLRQVNERDD